MVEPEKSLENAKRITKARPKKNTSWAVLLE
jgi:hypothetical protein